ncbi:DUF5994 family protein [Streptomyces sp. NPDC058287]|uniref:DUF5994 family protein n=1 Tax=Streptomyces sp. NPDC058287 TaxID=3346423 RepID=UPI0036EC713E
MRGSPGAVRSASSGSSVHPSGVLRAPAPIPVSFLVSNGTGQLHTRRGSETGSHDVRDHRPSLAARRALQGPDRTPCPQPVSPAPGQVELNGAWWPRSRDLSHELPAPTDVLDPLWGRITRMGAGPAEDPVRNLGPLGPPGDTSGGQRPVGRPADGRRECGHRPTVDRDGAHDGGTGRRPLHIGRTPTPKGPTGWRRRCGHMRRRPDRKDAARIAWPPR